MLCYNLWGGCGSNAKNSVSVEQKSNEKRFYCV